MEYGLSGLSMAMRILNQNQELARHSFNVARTCKAVTALLSENFLSMPENNICLAALYHDIGKSYWDQEWFYKAKKDLTKEELKQMGKHAIAGANLLKKLVPGIPKDILRLIKEHHERPNGKGYPEKLKVVSNETLLLASCDVFCACTETRGYRNGILTKKEALGIVADFAPEEIIEALLRLEEGCHEDKKGVNF